MQREPFSCMIFFWKIDPRCRHANVFWDAAVERCACERATPSLSQRLHPAARQERNPSEAMAAVDPRTPTMTTALEIVKGALSAVIGFPIGKSTIGSRISDGNKARITVVS